MDCKKSEPEYSLRGTYGPRPLVNQPLTPVLQTSRPLSAPCRGTIVVLQDKVFSCSPFETRFLCVPKFRAHQGKQAF